MQPFPKITAKHYFDARSEAKVVSGGIEKASKWDPEVLPGPSESASETPSDALRTSRAPEMDSGCI